MQAGRGIKRVLCLVGLALLFVCANSCADCTAEGRERADCVHVLSLVFLACLNGSTSDTERKKCESNFVSYLYACSVAYDPACYEGGLQISTE